LIFHSPPWRCNTIAVAAAGLTAMALAGACNKQEENDQQHVVVAKTATPPENAAALGNPIEQAFLQTMVPHHESAIEMARLAQERAKTAEIKAMAEAIIGAQSKEIAQMQGIHRRLFEADLQPDAMGHDKLGLTMDEAGMHMDMGGLKTADPFDKAFIDMMVPHHQGAIRMARKLLAATKDAELTKLGQDIIAAQSAEIEQMNKLRLKLYGAASPAGGAHDDLPAHEGHK
jgi:uncharacterized protein (DUF305 family)